MNAARIDATYWAMKRGAWLVGIVVLGLGVACGGGRDRSDPTRDGGDARDAGGLPDGAVPETDGAAPETDGGGLPDSGDADGGACVPTGGGATLTIRCDETLVAVLAKSDGPTRVEVSGRLLGPTSNACTRIDSVELMEGGRTIQTFGDARTVRTDDRGVWAAADATTDVSAPCSGDTGRFDTINVRLHGVTDGGTFEALCGVTPGSGGWPPLVVRSCHSGIDAPPFGGNALVMPLGSTTWTQLYGAFRHPEGTMLLTAGSDMHLIPFAYTGFGGGPPLMPSDSSGWTAFVNEMGDGYGGSFSQVSLSNDTDPFGLSVCPPGMTLPGPDYMPPPVFLARIAGTTSRGAFTSEIYIRMCTRPPAGP